MSKEIQELLANKRQWWVETGECSNVLRGLPDECVHMVVTSPPYYGLREYSAGSEEVGREKTSEDYIARMIEIFTEVRRVLRADGTLWLNLGDTLDDKDLVGIPWRTALALRGSGWCLRSDNIWVKLSPMPGSQQGWRWERCSKKIKGAKRGKEKFRAGAHSTSPNCDHGDGGFSKNRYHPCDGCDECKDNGGYVLRKGAWRTTTAHEYLFMLSKNKEYFSDGFGVRQKIAPATIVRDRYTRVLDDPEEQYAIKHNHETVSDPEEGANLRSWLAFKMENYKGDHYAVFPPDLPAVAIKCGTSEKGACPKCGGHAVRVLDYVGEHRTRWKPGTDYEKQKALGREGGLAREGMVKDYKTVGWRPSCRCGVGVENFIPTLVLDIFSGSGSTGIACQRVTPNRRYLGIELNEQFAEDSRYRLNTRGKGVRLPVARARKESEGMNIKGF